MMPGHIGLFFQCSATPVNISILLGLSEPTSSLEASQAGSRRPPSSTTSRSPFSRPLRPPTGQPWRDSMNSHALPEPTNSKDSKRPWLSSLMWYWKFSAQRRLPNAFFTNGRPVMAGSKGLQLCSAIDRFGGVAPWREYFGAFDRESRLEQGQHNQDSDGNIGVACLRGMLRMESVAGESGASNDGGRALQSSDPTTEADRGIGGAGGVKWAAVARLIDESDLPSDAVVDAVVDTCGYEAVSELEAELDDPSDFCLAVARAISKGRIQEAADKVESWVQKSVRHGIRPGTVHDLLQLGVDVESLSKGFADPDQADLVALTTHVQHSEIMFQSEIVEHWVDRCFVAALLDQPALDAAQVAIVGPGWYRCWLRFVVGLSGAACASEKQQSTLALNALRFLQEDLCPFEGEPRSCDLYSIHGLIDQTIRHAVELLDDERWPEAIRILQRVCDCVTTSLRGETMGPLPPIRFLKLVVETASASRYEQAKALVFDEIEHGSGGRHYSDLAEYQLIAARLAIACSDRQAVKARWIDACGMLTAYGSHKELTIFGLLDSLPSLIRADPALGRCRVALLQSLCWRLLRHTDGKETYYGWPKWWALLAEADPQALANLVARRLLSECNDPNSVLHEARTGLWRHWYKDADPFVAGTLRLTLSDPLTESDADALTRLAATIRELQTDPSARLANLLLTRADERPLRYRFSNSDELVDNDSLQVDRLNVVAAKAGLTTALPLSGVANDDSQAFDPNVNPSPLPSPQVESRPFVAIRPQFQSGSIGIAAATQVWSSVLDRDNGSAWTTDFGANLFGYRLVELADAGRSDEVITALRMIADADRYPSPLED